MEQHQKPHSIQHIVNMHVASLRARSDADLTQAIHSPSDDGFTVDRARICLKHYYDPDMSADDRAEMLDGYARALSTYPRWATAKAFDDWEKTATRRPSPGEIVILAGRAVKTLTDELHSRRPPLPPPLPPAPEPDPISPEVAAEIMAKAGFTPQRILTIQRAPMAATFAEAEERMAVPDRAHWSETAKPDDPAWEQLRRARAENTLIQQSIAAAKARP